MDATIPIYDQPGWSGLFPKEFLGGTNLSLLQERELKGDADVA